MVTVQAASSTADALFVAQLGPEALAGVSLVLPVHPRRDPASLPKGTMFRFNAGLEEAGDLIADLEQAARILRAAAP